MEDFRFEMIWLKDNIDVLMSCITQIDMASMRILKKAKNHLVGYFVLLLFWWWAGELYKTMSLF